MSDTPRTDAAYASQQFMDEDDWVRFAQKLERVLASALAAKAKAEAEIDNRQIEAIDLAIELSKAQQFLELEGYRRCDVPACNCGSWHRKEDR